eukprot:1711603-Ditylum_brightwellii.AAC.1
MMTMGMKKKKKLHILTITVQKYLSLYTTSQECHHQQKTKASKRRNLMMCMTSTHKPLTTPTRMPTQTPTQILLQMQKCSNQNY